MKRFITYLYEYNEGRRIKGAGFIRVNIRGNQVNMEVCIRNCIRTIAKGKVFALVKPDNLIGIELGEICLRGGQSNKDISFEKNHILDSSYSLNDVVGVVVDFNKDGYLASCWREVIEREIASGIFSVYTKEVIAEERKPDQKEEIASPVQAVDVKVQEIDRGEISYKKIELDQIREFPSPNWHLSNNSFLLHGAFNYGYLFLKSEGKNGEKKMWLGVPGYYEKPEMLMAVLFGFPEFEPVPKSVVDMEMNRESIIDSNEKNQEPKTGIFGGWFVLLDE